LEPFAYVLRDHPIFRSPIAIDRSEMVRRPWPGEWTDTHDSNEILVLPLGAAKLQKNQPGWCTYTNRMSDAPEIEVFCGGINAKTSTAAALWRQGNLLHYGFDLAPDEMNEWGRAMLVDAITYIARFTEDRPIMQTPSPFAGQEFITRPRIEQLMAHGDGWWDYLKSHFDQGALAAAGVNDLAAFAKWYPTVRDYLSPNSEGLLRVDAEAQAISGNPGRGEFFDRAIADLGRQGNDAERARRMLVHYAPEGPGLDANARAWADWWRANADYLFFGEAGGYRWYLDPLAKARGVPTARLRGPERASR
jgi:hypothetical protein